jgi:c-di-GMP-binding flagellar brake protein YcgR
MASSPSKTGSKTVSKTVSKKPRPSQRDDTHGSPPPRHRRQHYRVRSPGAGALDVVLERDGQEIAIALVDASAGGAALIVPTASIPAGRSASSLITDGKAVLSLRAPDAEASVRVLASPCNVRAVDGGFRLGISVEDSLEWRTALPEWLRAVFNERRALRVRPDVPQPVRVDVQVEGIQRWISAQLFDMSIQGAGLLLTPAVADKLPPGERVRLRIFLPLGTTVELSARLAASGTRGATEFSKDHVRLGVAFIEDEGSNAVTDSAYGSFLIRQQLAFGRRRDRKGD